MGIDYYAILDVNRDASSIEIKLAYRKWAAVSHPDNSQRSVRLPDEGLPENRPCQAMTRAQYWEILNEALEVLADPYYRHIFDVYGEEGLKAGIPTKDGYFSGERQFRDKSDKLAAFVYQF